MLMTDLTDEHIDIISSEISDLVSAAISARLDVDVQSIEFDAGTDSEGNSIIEVKIILAVKPTKWERGGMFDMVAAASRTLRENGIHQQPYFRTRIKRDGRLRAL